MRGLQALDSIRRRLSPAEPLRPRSDPSQLRVMTYNTHHGAGADDAFAIERVAATIESCAPDLVALQEVDRHWSERSGSLDQPSWYAGRLGLQVVYAANLVREPTDPRSPPGEYGLALLSRLPMESSGHHLYGGPHAEPRGLQSALITVPPPSDAGQAPRTVRLINTHLSVRDPRRREQEIRELLAYADSERDLPTVVAGDFNALTRARALRAMRTSYRDAWDVGLGSPATVFARRIDYLWMSRHFRPVQTVVIRSRASDHFALVSDLAWVEDWS
jgi:endonuclease/exonuclease/phosphatase family metal-dependent hydrolase